MRYEEFVLVIGPNNRGMHYVATRSLSGGDASAMITLPFEAREIETILGDINSVVVRSSDKLRRIPSAREQVVQEFGQRLFKAIFKDKVRDCYYAYRRLTAQKKKGMQIQLVIQDPVLATLPWEYLYDADQNDYICFSRETPIVRYTELGKSIQTLSVKPPLQILGMVASPRDLERLKVEHEKGLIKSALQELESNGLVELTWLAGATWRDLQLAMQRGPWHIFHFIGHGGFDQGTDEGIVALEDERGLTHRFGARELARHLTDHKSLKLVFLNSCEGARGSDLDLLSSTASTLSARGIPAVLAMQFAITDNAAIEFARTFYRSLTTQPIDAAVTEARKAISSALPDTLEWGTPVLYLRSKNSRLFKVTKESSTVQKQPERPAVVKQSILKSSSVSTSQEEKRNKQSDSSTGSNRSRNVVRDSQLAEIDTSRKYPKSIPHTGFYAIVRKNFSFDQIRKRLKGTSFELFIFFGIVDVLFLPYIFYSWANLLAIGVVAYIAIIVLFLMGVSNKNNNIAILTDVAFLLLWLIAGIWYLLRHFNLSWSPFVILLISAILFTFRIYLFRSRK